MLVAPLARPSRAATTAHVSIDTFAFKPASISVRRGDKVTWTNTDPVPHTVTAQGAFDSGSIAAGAAWTFEADRDGHFDYICTFHTMMKGTLIVA